MKTWHYKMVASPEEDMKDLDLPYKVNSEKFLLIEDIKNGRISKNGN
jgi:hypothetical protein